MRIISQVAAALQSSLGAELDRIGRETEVIIRQRKFSGSSLFQMLVLTLMKSPDATIDNFVATAAQTGVSVTAEGVEKRFTEKLITFLKAGLEHVLKQAFTLPPAALPLLEKFTAVEIGDSTTVTVPDEFESEFPGCGGTGDSGKAAVKLQVTWELRSESLTKLDVGPGRRSDAKSVAVDDPVATGSLTIRDLGYFSLARFRFIGEQKAYWISRWQQGTTGFDEDGRLLGLREWLRSQPKGEPVDVSVLLGSEERLPCRLIALRVPPKIADRRRQVAYEKAAKHGRTPTREHLDLCDWTIFVTNCGKDLLTWQEVVVLYRVRWKIELMFKLWKSHNQLATNDEQWTSVERMALFWAKLIGVIFQHWLLLMSSWSQPRHSAWKAAQVIPDWIVALTESLGDVVALVRTLGNMAATMAAVDKKKRQSKRPSQFQLLENPALLNWNA